MVEPVDPFLLLRGVGSCQRAASAGNTQREEDFAPRSTCILIVDDDGCVRETLAEILELEGYRVFQAENADAAASILRHAQIDILVTDLSMPGDDGIALIRRTRDMGQVIPVILLTGYAEETATMSTIAGVNIHVLRKPVEARQLLQQIGLLLQIDP